MRPASRRISLVDGPLTEGGSRDRAIARGRGAQRNGEFNKKCRELLRERETSRCNAPVDGPDIVARPLESNKFPCIRDGKVAIKLACQRAGEGDAQGLRSNASGRYVKMDRREMVWCACGDARKFVKSKKRAANRNGTIDETSRPALYPPSPSRRVQLSFYFLS